MKTIRKRLTLGKDTLARVSGGGIAVLTGACPSVVTQTIRLSCLATGCCPVGTSQCTISMPTGGSAQI